MRKAPDRDDQRKSKRDCRLSADRRQVLAELAAAFGAVPARAVADKAQAPQVPADPTKQPGAPTGMPHGAPFSFAKAKRVIEAKNAGPIISWSDTPLQDLVGNITPSGLQKTVESYWPFVTTPFDYIKRAMPFTQPGSLSDDEVYALCAFILAKGKIVPDDVVMDRTSLAAVKMPNRGEFAPFDNAKIITFH